jgi:hypothetical protein
MLHCISFVNDFMGKYLTHFTWASNWYVSKHMIFFWQLHFRAGVIGDSKITESAEEILRELDQLTGVVKEETTHLEACLAQLDQYQQVT